MSAGGAAAAPENKDFGVGQGVDRRGVGTAPPRTHLAVAAPTKLLSRLARAARRRTLARSLLLSHRLLAGLRASLSVAGQPKLPKRLFDVPFSFADVARLPPPSHHHRFLCAHRLRRLASPHAARAVTRQSLRLARCVQSHTRGALGIASHCCRLLVCRSVGQPAPALRRRRLRHARACARSVQRAARRRRARGVVHRQRCDAYLRLDTGSHWVRPRIAFRALRCANLVVFVCVCVCLFVRKCAVM